MVKPKVTVRMTVRNIPLLRWANDCEVKQSPTINDDEADHY